MILVVTKCQECPFLNQDGDQKSCNVALPKGRPVTTASERPSWCRLRREQIIVRDFK